MGYDKVSDHARTGAEYIVSADSSCLMHQQGCVERNCSCRGLSFVAKDFQASTAAPNEEACR
jgi:hypothetical protein